MIDVDIFNYILSAIVAVLFTVIPLRRYRAECSPRFFLRMACLTFVPSLFFFTATSISLMVVGGTYSVATTLLFTLFLMSSRRERRFVKEVRAQAEHLLSDAHQAETLNTQETEGEPAGVDSTRWYEQYTRAGSKFADLSDPIFASTVKSQDASQRVHDATMIRAVAYEKGLANETDGQGTDAPPKS